MRPLASLVLAFLALAFAPGLSAQETATEEPPRRAPHPSLIAVEDVAGLPRVLLIGDSISMGYTLPVRKLLDGKANVHRIRMNGGPTSRGMEHIDAWLGKTPWDVIHFNWGIHDLKRMSHGERQVEPEPYEANLRALIKKFRAHSPGAVLIWASTTPIPDGKLEPPREFGDEEEYNAIAARIMKEEDIATDDLYAYVLPEFERLQRPNDLHYSPEGSDYLAKKVAAAIEAALASR